MQQQDNYHDDDSDDGLIRKALGMPQSGDDSVAEDDGILGSKTLDELFHREHAYEQSLHQRPSTRAVSLSVPQRGPPHQTGLTRRCPTMLYLSCDPELLSQYQCLVRKQIELFEANEVDIEAGAQGRNKPIVLGQVGIRCRHCAFVPLAGRGRSAVFYPSKLVNVYQASQNIAAHHLQDSCTHIPAHLKQELCSLKDKKARAGYGKDHWAKTAAVLGVFDDESGLRFLERVDL